MTQLTDAPRTAAAAGEHDRASGLALVVAASVSNQAGAAVGALAFPAIGPVGVVAVRQIVTALVLTASVRPRLRTLRRGQWMPIIGLALAFSVMNLGLYAAVERIGLGLAVTLEFLGPLAVAILSSRRRTDIACAMLAGVGVVVLTDPGPSTDLVGIALALTAAAAWAGYILLNRAVGRRVPGIQGTAAASLLTGLAWLPVAALWFLAHPPTPLALVLAATCGVLASVIPYVFDLLALRRIPASLFGTLTSLNPVWAALAGWAVLGQLLTVQAWVGLGLIVTANAIVSVRGARLRPTRLTGG